MAAITGLDEVSKKLKTLGNDKVAKRIARKSAREGMKLVQAAAKQNAESVDDLDTKEKIANNIVIRSGRINDKGAIRMRVGVLGGAKSYAAASGEVQGAGKNNPGGDTFYWRFVEFGTKHSAAKPFMRIALFNNIDSTTNKFAEVFMGETDKELSKL
ncbi:HK97-gp10 family putative phage morphogenesis protein [Acinetobacter puyangensis]|uniref:HK97-gp10 family putative phage morphogenesis protein n=1 Tax=Acinetobacter puyangensis TaxID=1096779 RepID=UPI003A4E1AE3